MLTSSSFVNQEEEFYNLYREAGPAKAFRVSVFFQMHNDSLQWLLGAVKPHPSYITALDSPHGYAGSFITHDENFKPRYLRKSPGVRVTVLLRLDRPVDQGSS